MEFPYATGLVWTVGLVLFGQMFGESFLPIVAIAILGIHLGFALVPRRENDTGRQHAQAGEGQPGSIRSAYVQDRGNAHRAGRVGCHEVSWLRNRRTKPAEASRSYRRIRVGQSTVRASVGGSAKVGVVREFSGDQD